MKQNAREPIGRVYGGLLALAFLGAPFAAGCGRVKADDTGSETHWLARCDSDADCAEGSCECGVCSLPCSDAPPECSELGIAGVQCTSEPSACGVSGAAQGGSAPASGGACLLPCTEDADCGELGARASCRGGRCELPATSIVSGAGGLGATGGTSGSAGASGGTASGGQSASGNPPPEIATLCDGSEDVRLTYVVDGGFQDLLHPFLADPFGYRSFVIDGQCRFWQTRARNGWAYTGTLDAAAAQDFAEVIGYGRLASFSSFEDEQCDDGTISTLAAPEGSIRCSCQCTTHPAAPAGWLAAFRAVSIDAQAALFEAGETVTGPARMVLLTPRYLTSGFTTRDWPLGRNPDDNAVVVDNGNLILTPSSGVLLEDPAELAALRQLRAEFFASLVQPSALEAVPVFWSTASTAAQFDLLLRDEVPQKVRAALESAVQ